MSPDTRNALGLVPLPAEQAARIEAQQRALAAGNYARWPAGLEHVALQRTPPIEAVELDPDSGWAQWDLAVKLADAKRDERRDAECMEALERREWVRL